MSDSIDLMNLPPDLPVPKDDGATDHLMGMRLPDIPLATTDGSTVFLADLPCRSVVYAYPRTGEKDRPVPPGWDAIPGARGCTPQSCAFRDHHSELRGLGARVFGFSTQTSAYQREAVERLRLPFPLLSDHDLAFTRAMKLPTFAFDGMTLTRRVTLIVRGGVVEHVFYPVFPPNRNAADVIAWLSKHPISAAV